MQGDVVSQSTDHDHLESGQKPAPYNAFPFIALALVAAAAALGCLVVHRNPHAGASEGAEA